MNKTDPVVDPRAFERLLSRNVKLPLLGGLFGAVLFVSLIAYLLSVIGWVEHTDRVTHNVSEAQRLSVDLETGMRGFVITGEESFLSPYDSAQPQIAKSLALVREMVKDNPAQAERIDRITTLQTAWNQYASEVIALRRSGGDYLSAMRRGQGKRLTDAMRADYAEVMNVEQQLRFERNRQANNTSLGVIGVFLLFTLTATGLLAYFGRRQLVRLSEDYGRTLARQEAAATTLAEQAWVRSRQTELAGRLVGELGLREAGVQVLDFFARHVDSTVGAVYVRDNAGGFGRIASYGFSPEAEAAPQVFGANHGLVGQAARERRLMRAEPLSADYLKVNSGLGSMAPKAVLLLPVAADGHVNGVVE
ncbi:MAG: two-component system sensor histidine kinase/response regulator, partial [Variovorax sp.]